MEIDINNMNVEFVSGKEEYLYQPVLDDIPYARQVRLMTFNIDSKKESELYDVLHKIRGNADFKWVFNIPNRDKDGDYKKWYQKKNPNYVSNLRKNLNTCVTIIESEKFRCKVQAAENDENHAKIFGTENVLYIGSQNFSTASKNNYEVGVIVKDKKYIKQIYKQFFDEVYYAKESIRNYHAYGKEIDNTMWEIMLTIDIIIKLFLNLVSEKDAADYDSFEAEKIHECIKKECGILMDQINIIFDQEEKVDGAVINFLGEIAGICENMEYDDVIQELLYYNYYDALEMEEEEVMNKSDDWAKVRDDNVEESFKELLSFIENTYVNGLFDISSELDEFLESKKNLLFKNELDNTPK